jgi:hypothetical protein
MGKDNYFRKKRFFVYFLLLIGIIVIIIEINISYQRHNKIIYYSNYSQKNKDDGFLENMIIKKSLFWSNCLMPIMCKSSIKLSKKQIIDLTDIVNNKNNYEFGQLGTCGTFGCIIFYNKFGYANRVIFLNCGINQLQDTQNRNTLLLNDNGYNKLKKLLNY